MSLAAQLREQIADPALTHDERALRRVRLSRVLEEAGDFEGAREAMGELWQRIGERPALEGLDRRTSAEVLLQAGILTSCIGSAKAEKDAQETAKNLITESITIFEALGDSEKVAEARTEMALCYWRQGSYEDARALLDDVLGNLADKEGELAAVTWLRYAIIERAAKRYHEALRIHTDTAYLFGKTNNHSLRGRFHVGFALVLRTLGTAENRPDYIDRALIEYEAASYHFEQAGHERYCARVENNLGFLFSTIRKFNEAHEHLDRARRIFARLKDKGSVAQVDDTRAKAMLAEGRHSEAEQVARSAVRTLEKGGDQSTLAEALTTHGVSLARLSQHSQARQMLQRAITVAEQVGDLKAAGEASLAIVEELGEHSTPNEAGIICEQAADLLKDVQHPGITHRLLSSTQQVLRMFLQRSQSTTGEFTAPSSWQGFSLKNELRRYERFLIERALREAEGAVTRAAHLLGFKHHGSLIALINSRHRKLLSERTPVVPRRRSIIRDVRTSSHRTTNKVERPVTILHVEDNKIVADAMKSTLEAEGWTVEVCGDGITALRRIISEANYNLIILDNELPGVKGIEVVRIMRKLPHRRRTPTIMLSAADCETEAWRAGADAFLKKPDEVLAVVKTIARLLHIETKLQ